MMLCSVGCVKHDGGQQPGGASRKSRSVDDSVQLLAKNEKLKSDNAALEATISKLRDEISSLEKEVDGLKRKYEAVEKRRKKADAQPTSENRKTRAYANEKRKLLDAREEDIDEMGKDAVNIAARTNELEQRVGGLRKPKKP